MTATNFQASSTTHFSPLNFNFGYAVGVRLRLTKRAFLNARVCQFSHLQGGDEVDVINHRQATIDVSSTSTTSATLPPNHASVGRTPRESLAFDS